jgi:cation transport regulator ChaC
MEEAVIDSFGYGVCIWSPMADIARIVISGTIATGSTNPCIAFVPVRHGR